MSSNDNLKTGDFIRDKNSHALLNVRNDQLSYYKLQREQAKKEKKEIETLKKEISFLKEEIHRLEELIKDSI